MIFKVAIYHAGQSIGLTYKARLIWAWQGEAEDRQGAQREALAALQAGKGVWNKWTRSLPSSAYEIRVSACDRATRQPVCEWRTTTQRLP